MKKRYDFLSKPTKIFILIMLVLGDIAIVLTTIFTFCVLGLLIFTILLTGYSLLLLWVLRRKIIISDDSLIIVEFSKRTINVNEILTIKPVWNGIEIQTEKERFFSGGYYFLKFPNEEKNEKIVEELNNWLKKYKNIKGTLVK